MIAEAQKKLWTDKELMALPDDGNKYELVEGELVMSPAGFEHGDISTALVERLRAHARLHRLGRVADSSTGFKMANGNVLSPDVSFVANERFKTMKRLPKGFFQGAPDLAVEVLSPGESKRHLERKAKDYFANGTRLSWVINPEEPSVAVYRSTAPHKVLSIRDTLEGEDVVPGFAMPVSELFEPFPWADG